MPALTHTPELADVHTYAIQLYKAQRDAENIRGLLVNAMRRARETGATLQAIGDAAGVSRTYTHRLLKEQTHETGSEALQSP